MKTKRITLIDFELGEQEVKTLTVKQLEARKKRVKAILRRLKKKNDKQN